VIEVKETWEQEERVRQREQRRRSERAEKRRAREQRGDRQTRKEKAQGEVSRGGSRQDSPPTSLRRIVLETLSMRRTASM
jgi:hypothetical protein